MARILLISLILVNIFGKIIYSELIFDNDSLFNILTSSLDCGCDRKADKDVSNTVIEVYNFETNTNNSYPIATAAENLLSNDFNPNQTVVIFIPGFMSVNFLTDNALCVISKMIRNDMKTLAIVINHSAYTKSDNIIDSTNVLGFYKKVVPFIKSIGVTSGEFLVKLLQGGVQRGNLKIAGHSLGAIIAGYMGEVVINLTGEAVEEITGIDPAKPCYDNCLQEQIKSGQAKRVILIHCNAGGFGTRTQADYDFYSKDGMDQDKCPGGDVKDLAVNFLASRCSHFRCVSISLYPAIVNNEWKSYQCPSSEAYYSNSCVNNSTINAGFATDLIGPPGRYYFTPDLNIPCEPDVYAQSLIRS